MQVRWNATLSPAFSVTNGVRQGDQSPITILFTIYMDNFLSGLKGLGIGCYRDSFFAGAARYADHVALLAPALRMMLHFCEDFAALEV